MRKEDGRGSIFRQTLHFLMKTASVGRFIGLGTNRLFGGLELVPLKSAGVALKTAGSQVLEGAGAVPRALVVTIEDLALGIESDAAR